MNKYLKLDINLTFRKNILLLIFLVLLTLEYFIGQVLSV